MAGAPFSFADLVERVSPAVVTITSETMTSGNDGDDNPAIAVANVGTKYIILT